jgi:hypothetical protein
MSSQEVKEAVGLEGETLEQRRERLRQVVATPSERDLAARELLEVEREIAERDLATLEKEVSRRVLGIVRSMGSLADQAEQDERRRLDAAKEYAAAAATHDERVSKLVILRHEAIALCQVSGLALPTLPAITFPAASKLAEEAGVLAAGAAPNGADRYRIDAVVRWEMTERGNRRTEERTFEELEGTPGFELIRRKLGK